MLSPAMKKLTGTFRNTQWDPYLLVAQIVAMQALLYVSLGTIMYVMDFFAEANHTLDHIFEYHVSEDDCFTRRKCLFPTSFWY